MGDTQWNRRAHDERRTVLPALPVHLRRPCDSCPGRDYSIPRSRFALASDHHFPPQPRQNVQGVRASARRRRLTALQRRHHHHQGQPSRRLLQVRRPSCLLLLTDVGPTAPTARRRRTRSPTLPASRSSSLTSWLRAPSGRCVCARRPSGDGRPSMMTNVPACADVARRTSGTSRASAPCRPSSLTATSSEVSPPRSWSRAHSSGNSDLEAKKSSGELAKLLAA